MPNNSPFQAGSEQPRQRISLRRIDFLGAFLLLGAMTLYIRGFEQPATLHKWTSADVLPLLIVLALFRAAFLASQWHLAQRPQPDPILPWRFFQSRVTMGFIFQVFADGNLPFISKNEWFDSFLSDPRNSLLTGAVTITCIVSIPLLYQASTGVSAMQIGVRLIPLTVAIQIGGPLVAILTKKMSMPPIYLLFVASAFQLLGTVLLSRETPDDPVFMASWWRRGPVLVSTSE